MNQIITIGGDIDKNSIFNIVAQQSGDLLKVFSDAFNNIVVEGKSRFSIIKEKSKEI